jgi:hypothetical protein
LPRSNTKEVLYEKEEENETKSRISKIFLQRGEFTITKKAAFFPSLEKKFHHSILPLQKIDEVR